MMNNGQACVAQTRILAPRSRYDEVVDAITEQTVAAMKVGDPTDFETARRPAHRRAPAGPGRGLHRDRHATRAPASPPAAAVPTRLDDGWFVEPTVFVGRRQQHAHRPGGDLRPGGRRSSPTTTPTTPCAIANDTDYGLSGSVWCGDVDDGLDVARRVRTGTYSRQRVRHGAGAPRSAATSSRAIGRELGPGRARGVPRVQDDQPARRDRAHALVLTPAGTQGSRRQRRTSAVDAAARPCRG